MGIFEMAAHLWSMFGKLFMAGEKASDALLKVATIGDEMAGNALDKARLERQAERKALEQQYGITLEMPVSPDISGKVKALKA